MSYHSSNPSDPDVYHDSETCTDRCNRSLAKNRVPGKGGNRPCKQCAS